MPVRPWYPDSLQCLQPRARYSVTLPFSPRVGAKRLRLAAPVSYASLQRGHSFRTSRTLTTPTSDDATMKGSSPRSMRRVTAPAASLVCTVLSTRWPVTDARNAICAVSLSRISPIMTTSGSWRRIARSAVGKDFLPFSSTWTWLIPGTRISTGSSTVTMLSVSSWISRRAA